MNPSISAKRPWLPPLIVAAVAMIGVASLGHVFPSGKRVNGDCVCSSGTEVDALGYCICIGAKAKPTAPAPSPCPTPAPKLQPKSGPSGPV